MGQTRYAGSRTAHDAQDRSRPARRILLVEDHPVERAYLQNMLLALGCRRVAGVGSGAEALAALTRQSYDVLISDIAMGEGGGTRLPNELRRLRTRAA